MSGVEVLLPTSTFGGVMERGTFAGGGGGGGGSVDQVMLDTLGSPEPRRAIRRPSGTAESESDTPPSKKSKKNRRRRKKNARRRLNPLHVPPSLRGALQNKPVAPFNTTQFLMAEHDQLQDTDIVNRRPRRQRDSSLSMDSDEGDYYSSPEDEEEFLMREFWTAYEDVHAERLDTMTKAQLIQEYVALEERVELLERQLRVVRQRHTEEDEESSPVPGELPVDPETAEKIRIFKNEIDSLSHENQRLRQENDFLRRSSSAISSSSSSDSEGGSSSSSSSSSSGSSSSSSSDSSDSEDEDRRRRRVAPAGGPPSSEASCDRAAVQEAEATAAASASPCSQARGVEALDSSSVCSSGVTGPVGVLSTSKTAMAVLGRGEGKCSDSGVSSGASDSSSDPSTSEAASPSSCEPSLGLVASTDSSSRRSGEAEVRVKSEGVEEEGEGEGAVSSTTQA